MNDGLVYILLLVAVIVVPALLLLPLAIAVIKWLNRH